MSVSPNNVTVTFQMKQATTSRWNVSRMSRLQRPVNLYDTLDNPKWNTKQCLNSQCAYRLIGTSTQFHTWTRWWRLEGSEPERLIKSQVKHSMTSRWYILYIFRVTFPRCPTSTRLQCLKKFSNCLTNVSMVRLYQFYKPERHDILLVYLYDDSVGSQITHLIISRWYVCTKFSEYFSFKTFRSSLKWNTEIPHLSGTFPRHHIEMSQ